MKNLAYSPYPFKELFLKSSIIFYSCKFEKYFPVSFISPNVENILGFRDQYFLENDQLWVKHIHPDDRNKVLTSYEDIKESAKRTIDFRFKHRNGEYRWLRDEIILQTNKKGEPESIIGTSFDITKRKKAERKLESTKDQLENKVRLRTKTLKKRKERFRTILELSFDAILEIDSTGVILDCNKKATKYFGYSQAELIGMHTSKLQAQCQTKLATNILSNFTTPKNEVWERIYQKKDGTIFPAEVNTKKIIIDNEVRLIAFIRDISDRKKTENELKESLEEKRVLLIEIHHRVKNNLAVIISLLTLQSLNTDNPNFQITLQEVITRIHSIALVHEQLYQTDTFSKISIDKYINELLSSITDTLKSNIVSIQIDKEIEPISLNINQAIPCGMILNELLTNAHKHAFTDQEKGKINIKVKRDSDNLVTLRVRDNGKGLPDSFDSSVKSLGFTIIDQLVKQLKGTLNTNFKNGSCFEIKFRMK